MMTNKSKSSFSIDDILCEDHILIRGSSTHKPTAHAFDDVSSIEYNKFPSSFIPSYVNSFNLNPSRYYFPLSVQAQHLRHLTPITYIDHYTNAFHKGMNY